VLLLMVMLRFTAPLAKVVPPLHANVLVYWAALAPPPKVSAGRVTTSPAYTVTAVPVLLLLPLEVELTVGLLVPPVEVTLMVWPVAPFCHCLLMLICCAMRLLLKVQVTALSDGMVMLLLLTVIALRS
jgi:hypothetical protein